MPNKISESKIKKAAAELEKVRKGWLRRPGVTAVDVGYRIKDGKPTGELAIRVHVRRKLPTEILNGYELFQIRESEVEESKKRGENDRERKRLDEFSVDVIEAEYGPSIPSAAVTQPEAINRCSHVDPLVCGISVGNPRVTAGTLGAIVWDKTDGEVCILSNWHVLCGSSACTAGEGIYQPGVADGGTAADKVAELKRWRLDKDADAALAKLTGARSYSRDILGLNPILGIEENPSLGMHVTKSGRTTDVTEGIIDGVKGYVTIDYGGGTKQTFRDQIHILPLPPWPEVDYELSSGGDSGSVWIDKDTGKAVGLHFAGEIEPSPTAEHAFANRMVKVAELLDFSFTPLFRPRRVPDDRLRDVLRRILGRYYPWLYYSQPSLESFPPAQVSPPLQPPMGSSPYWPGRQLPNAYPIAPIDIESLLDEIMDELRRAG